MSSQHPTLGDAAAHGVMLAKCDSIEALAQRIVDADEAGLDDADNRRLAMEAIRKMAADAVMLARLTRRLIESGYPF